MNELVTVLFILFAYQVSACICTCIETEFSIIDYNSAELIVKGKVIKVDRDDETKVIMFKVYHSLKGNSKRIIKIRTLAEGAMCGLDINNQDKWLLFINKKSNMFYVDLCDKNVRYNKRPNQSIEDWNVNNKKMKSYFQKLKALKKL